MWILLGLFGMLAASGAGVMLMRPAAEDDLDEDPSSAPPAEDGDAAGAGDMLDFAGAGGDVTPPDPVVPGAGSSQAAPLPDPDAADETAEGEPAGTTATDTRAPDTSGSAPDTSTEGEFISTDQPQPPPEDVMINLGENGDAGAGGAGNDLLNGGAGHDWLEGEDGDDRLSGNEGDDMLIGAAGADALFGGAGRDTLAGGPGDNLLDGGDGADSLIGGSERDTLLGGAGDDTLAAGGGDDRAIGGRGADLLMGGSGNDWLEGGGDSESEGPEADTLNGGEGDDTLVLGAGDLGHGGDGRDDFVLTDRIDGGTATIADFVDGEDRIVIEYASDIAPQVDRVFDPETGALRLVVDGEIVAILPNVQSIGADSIILTRTHGG